MNWSIAVIAMEKALSLAVLAEEMEKCNAVPAKEPQEKPAVIAMERALPAWDLTKTLATPALEKE